MEDIKKILQIAAQNISEKVSKGYIGDSLNLVNVCTLYREYIDTKSAVLYQLFDGINNQPKSQAADSHYETILRISSATLLGYGEFWDYDSGLSLTKDDYPSFREKRKVDSLYKYWQDNPLDYGLGQFSTFLLGQYFYRLEESDISDTIVTIEDKYAITHQMLGFVPHLIFLVRNNHIGKSRFLDQMLFGAVVCYKLKVDHVGRAFLNLFAAHANEILDEILELAHSDQYDKFIQENVSDIGFILHNIAKLPEALMRTHNTIIEKLKQLAFSKMYLRALIGSDLRINAITLQGIKLAVDEEMIAVIANELNCVNDFDILIKLKQILSKSFDYKVKLVELLEQKSFFPNSSDINRIHAFIQSITFTQIDGSVKHPIGTIESMKGDCKAISALVCFLAVEQGIPCKICLYIGSELGETTNHIYIELYDDKQQKYVAVDHGAPIGKANKCVENTNLILRYPVNSILKYDNSVFLADMYAKRYRIFDILSRSN